nr:hypothetical protein [Brevibacillus laterosporus]
MMNLLDVITKIVALIGAILGVVSTALLVEKLWDERKERLRKRKNSLRRNRKKSK